MRKVDPTNSIEDNQLAFHTTEFDGVNILVTLTPDEEGKVAVSLQTDRDDLTKKQSARVAKLVQDQLEVIFGEI